MGSKENGNNNSCQNGSVVVEFCKHALKGDVEDTCYLGRHPTEAIIFNNDHAILITEVARSGNKVVKQRIRVSLDSGNNLSIDKKLLLRDV